MDPPTSPSRLSPLCTGPGDTGQLAGSEDYIGFRTHRLFGEAGPSILQVCSPAGFQEQKHGLKPGYPHGLAATRLGFLIKALMTGGQAINGK